MDYYWFIIHILIGWGEWNKKDVVIRYFGDEKNKENSINKGKTMKCIFCLYLDNEVSCHKHFPFVSFFTDALSEKGESTYSNHIYGVASIVVFFSIVFTSWVSMVWLCLSKAGMKFLNTIKVLLF